MYIAFFVFNYINFSGFGSKLKVGEGGSQTYQKSFKQIKRYLVCRNLQKKWGANPPPPPDPLPVPTPMNLISHTKLISLSEPHLKMKVFVTNGMQMGFQLIFIFNEIFPFSLLNLFLLSLPTVSKRITTLCYNGSVKYVAGHRLISYNYMTTNMKLQPIASLFVLGFFRGGFYQPDIQSCHVFKVHATISTDYRRKSCDRQPR